MVNKGFIAGLFFGVLLVIVAIVLIGNISLNRNNITGNAINAIPNNQLTQNSNKPIEQIIIDERKNLKENMYLSQSFEIYKTAKVIINLTSNEFVNYALLPNYEVDHYIKGESYKSYANSEDTLYIQDNYNLNEGKYAVVVTSKDKPTVVSLIVKVVELQ